MHALSPPVATFASDPVTGINVVRGALDRQHASRTPSLSHPAGEGDRRAGGGDDVVHPGDSSVAPASSPQSDKAAPRPAARRGDVFFAELAQRPPFTQLHPHVAAFFKEYFAREKVIPFGTQAVVNTHFPPYPSAAFDQLVRQFGRIGAAGAGRLYSVTLAVTNRCPFDCWHCYNAGRCQQDLPLAVLRRLAADLQDRGAVMITLTGGEPLLRTDLPEIVQSFDARSCVVLGTTGEGLTPERARQLKDQGMFAVGISLDALDEAEHDRLRGRPGAFRSALGALAAAREAGLYPYVVAVATRELLRRERFLRFLAFAGQVGALEVHLLEPSAVGRLAEHPEVMLTAAERRQIFDYQAEVAGDAALPILSSFAYLESPDAFGCGAGLTHLYIDGSGEVCPCNLVPLSFGNVAREPLDPILDRMGRCFERPRTSCVARQIGSRLPPGPLPLAPEPSRRFCEQHLPRRHPVPAFFRIRDAAQHAQVGQAELQAAYDRVHDDYDAFWLTAAAPPIDRLIDGLPWTGTERVFEAGCGTGYATAQLARRAAEVMAADLSPGMLLQARRRLAAGGEKHVRLEVRDALAALGEAGSVDLVFSSWVLGYIPLDPFFAAAHRALVPGGRLAFIVHRENSPRTPLEIFGALVAEDPRVLLKRVAFDFPPDRAHLHAQVAAAGFEIETLLEDEIVFRYPTARQVFEHLLKSGAGTAFYEAVDPARRDALSRQFLDRMIERNGPRPDFEVRHDYLACVARRLPL